MTNNEINAVFKDAIAHNIQTSSSLPEDIAQSFGSWVQSIIKAAQLAKTQPAQAEQPQQVQAQKE